MYNKIFTKILDSSIWLAPDPQRIVWITFLAAMDEDGHAMFASVANVASRARVSLEDARAAIAAFEGPDPDSGDPDNEGRRIERFPGGWHVLNAHKYRAMVTKTIIREQTRLRVEKHRSKTASNASVTHGNAKGAESNASVTPSVALALSESKNNIASKPAKVSSEAFAEFWAQWPKHPRKVARSQCEQKWKNKGCDAVGNAVLAALAAAKSSEAWTKNNGEFIPSPLVWINQSRWEAPTEAEHKARSGASSVFAGAL